MHPKAESAEMEMEMIENSEDWQLQSPGSVCKIQVEKEKPQRRRKPRKLTQRVFSV
jgi:hypothetical protein